MKEITLIDSHCHLVFSNFNDDLDEVAARWRSVGVKSLLHACVEPSEIPSIRVLADRFPELRYSVGVHPLDTEHWKSDTKDLLRKYALEDSRVVAIGELGLDLYKETNLEKQLEILIPQIELAFDLNLPIIVHCRDAAEPMIDLFRSLSDKGKCPKGVLHCWGGTVQEMANFLEMGFYISFSGVVTFPRAKETHECALAVPEDRFLVETDSPFLAPIPNRGKRNEPAYVRSVALKIAEIREVSLDWVADRSTANARKLFNLP